jgi:putative tricarboxylic transport membrane protein
VNKLMSEIAVCGAIIAVAVLAYRDSLKLPAGMYDPLGAGTLPRIVCVAIIALAVVAIVQAFVARRTANAKNREEPALDYVQRPGLAAAVFAYLVVFAAVVKAGIPFWISSSLFLFASTLTIADFRRSAVLPAIAFSLIAGIAVTYLFGHVFGVDLP